MIDLEFFLSPLLEATAGHLFSSEEARKNFGNDVKLFLEKQKRDTSLDVFFFANRSDIRDDKDYLKLEDIYIPIRLKQINESLPDREDFLQHFDVKTAKNRKAPKLPDDLNIAQLLTKISSGHEDRQIMLIGNGGSGKSTFMKYLARFFTEKTDLKVRVLVENKAGELTEKQVKIKHHCFPVFIRLRDLEQTLRQHNSPNWEDNFNLAHFLQAKHGLQFSTEQFYPKVLQQLPCLILLDGIDEVPEYKDCGNGLIISRRKIMNWINTQVKVFGATQSKTTFILTSRPADLSLLGRSFQVYELKKFSEGEIRLFTEYWYSAYENMLHYCVRSEIYGSRKDTYQRKIELLPENKGKFLENLNNPHLAELINNPLLLSQAILIHSIDESFELSDIDSLYEKFIDTLLYRWDDVRQMNFYPELLGSRNVQRLFQLMGRIAFAFSKREVTKMTFEDLLPEVVKAVSRFKSSLPFPDKIVELSTELLDVLRDRGGIFTGGVIAEDRNQTEYEFQHKSIQDYLTAYTLATDHSLWQSDGFDLFAVIDRREFWGRTLEFFVNVKRGNPDAFFRMYLKKLKPESWYSKMLINFVDYYLIAQEKEYELDTDVTQRCETIFMNSQDLIEIQLAQQCLNKLPIVLSDQHLAFISNGCHDLLGNFRAVRLAQLYFAKRKIQELTPILRETCLNDQIDLESGDFYRFRNYCQLGLMQRDYQIWNAHLMVHRVNKPPIIQLCQSLFLLNLRVLLDFLDSRPLRDLLDLNNLMRFRDLEALQELQKFQDFRNLRNLKNLRLYLPFLDLRSSQNLSLRESTLFDEYQRFTQSEIFPRFMSAMSKVEERFHALTIDQKRQYFINVDE